MSTHLLLLAVLVACVASSPFLDDLPRISTHIAAIERTLAVSVRADVDCGTITVCKSVGQNCTRTTNTFSACTDVESHCSTTSGLCVKNLPDGAACAPTDDCLLESQCVSQVCTANKIAAGDACTTGSSCLSGTCTNSVCIGKDAGGSCSSTDDCNTGTYCNTHYFNCSTSTPTNGVCKSTDECGFVDSCIPTSATGDYSFKCLQIGSVPAGGFCVETDDCAVDGNACLPLAGTLIGTCGSLPQPSNLPCYNNSQCGQYESCTCNAQTGAINGYCTSGYVTFLPGRGALVTAAVSCLNSKCGNSPTTACALSSCVNPLCSYLDSVSNSIVSFYANLAPACVFDYAKRLIAPLPPQCIANTVGSSTSPANIVLPSIAFLVLVALPYLI